MPRTGAASGRAQKSAGKKPQAGRAKSRKRISFRERLARLTYIQACRLLGDEGEQLLGKGGRRWDLNTEDHAYLAGDLFRVSVPDESLPTRKANVVLTQVTARKQELHLRCDQCETPCEHAGAALSLLLEQKLPLGLSAPPDETVPFELLTEQELLERALDERRQRAQQERMTLRSSNPDTPWTEYNLTSHQSGKTYRVSLLGERPGEVYCSCPDFRTNHLGTCKHIIYALDKVQTRFRKRDLQSRPRIQQTSLWIDYRGEAALRFTLPDDPPDDIRSIIGRWESEPLGDASTAMECLSKLQRAGHDVLVYPDAEEWIEQELLRRNLQGATAEIRENPEEHPLRTTLLKQPLLPYQLDGVAFAAGAGRAILADDMGLGKTIQGIAVGELLARLVGIQRVLVVCPASVKGQWRDEIQRFTDRSVEIVIGRQEERRQIYEGDAFFTICNYEQILRDLEPVEHASWDLIILDEGQRIKNWESKTSQVIRSLRSRFALVLSGTPLENRLDELYTVVKFVDDRRLGPAFRFFHKHRRVDDNGRVIGIRKLDELREQLKPILLRRTRSEILKQLPERTNTVIRIRPTEEQLELHDGHMRTVAQITGKAYLTEMDLLRLQKALLMCRLCANGTGLVDKEGPNYSSKLVRLTELLEELAQQSDRKIVLFSEWKRMHDQIEPILERLEMPFVRLDGSVPQKQRPALVQRFQTDPDCRVILLTNAGSTGLNLQSANTVINVDLPWNPAVLEQRIGRAHRMGQKNPVQVYLLVTEETLEERLLDTLASKAELAEAALDAESDVDEVQMQSGIEELRRRVERLLGNKPEAPVDCSMQSRVEEETRDLAERRERVGAAGGQLVGAALQLVGELIGEQNRPAPDPVLVNRLRDGLQESVERDEAGRPQLRFTLPDDESLSQFATTLARLLVPQEAS
ncbi:MAG: helicase [Planctomycetota bacterium]|nr:MAG: helicase [Planctomycetota bacterium]REJ87788.1 MAG: helicase [Planctomycetota bacterium]REK27872.1 MAG: helicase [Planctomycetota bacterium]REK32816.1 MAG: helicase [Planctomycetota bacterium]